MGTGGVLPDLPVRAEIVHESERTRVTRLFFPGRTVIRKEPLGPDVERRLRHELAMLERLRGVEGVAQLVDAPRYPGSILLEDVDGTSLARPAKPLAVDELIELAVEVARAVAEMHRRGVMHRDITPANIVVCRDGAPCLVDFALATSVAEVRPEFTHHNQIVGTLAYLAPEQTGRTGRPADQRADLYALGATLYELATGGPPFGFGDPLRLTHDHLARVPVAPAQVNRALPGLLSEIVMHLLEKEPDHRYQTADGVVHDLQQVRDAQARPAAGAPRVGERDVPPRLLPPSRLVGREDEVATLEAAFEEALAGRCRGVLVGGAPGVGKTALVDQLRPVVTGRHGWFVAGKFDQYRRDMEFDAGYQAFRALGRLLLAEPEDELAEIRERILEALSANAGLATAAIPEFAALLAVPPDPGDPLTAQVRAQRTSVQILRAVASRKRPLAVFLDDLQWAGRVPLGFLDLVLSDEPVEGLLLVGAYRDGDIDAAYPLAASLSRWRDQADVQHLRLANLPAPSLGTLVAEMLHVDPTTAAGLVEVIEPHTAGNPYETVELLNALRRHGVLAATAAGWRWDIAAVRAHLGRSEMAGLLAARVNAIPAQSRAMVEAMACLGGRAELSVLQTATGEPAGGVDQALAPALDEGLLVEEPGAHQAVRFRHDRIRESILGELDPERRRTLQLAMARRLAGVPELFAVAAEQYLPVTDAIHDPAERRRVVGLLRRAADQASLIGDHALVHTLLAAALRLIDPGQTATLVEVHVGRHAALYSLGRLDEADEEYRTIDRLCPTALQRADATVVQGRSLTHRRRFADAIGLALDSLRELGIAVPAADRLPAQLDHQFEYLYRWLDHTDAADDLARPEITDPTLIAATRLIHAVMPAAYFEADLPVFTWLGLEALRIWLEHGPGRTLLGPASGTTFAAVALRGDYAAGYRAVRRILALGEARGYEPETSHARFLFAYHNCWFEPIENSVDAAQRAREGLVAGGALAYAGYAYYPAVAGLVECAPSLDAWVAEVEAGLAFARRTGNEQTAQWLDSYRWLAGVLRGESPAAADEPVPIEGYADNPLALFHAYYARLIAAAIFGDSAGLARHTAAAIPLQTFAVGLYPTATLHLLHGLALAGQARGADADTRGGLLAELDEVTGWLAARAADAPDNFLHLLRLLEAERAWAVGDFRAAVLAFDAARQEAAGRQRPWHRALIAERAARFYLAHGVEHAGYDLLAQARREYLAWGATAKVGQLDWAYPTLRPHFDPSTDQPGDLLHQRATVTTGTLDLLGILSASQALSSETTIERLHARVVEVLRTMTGATDVHLLLWDDDRRDWLLPAPGGDGGAARIGGTGHENAVPMSVLRYAQRTGEPLVVADATGDDRFARDPYFADLAYCSLLAVPILSRGTLRAVLLLENRLLRDAFTTGRLDAVKLIAGQLAVSLDNAQLYAEYRRIADEQAALRRVATLVARAAPPEEVFAAVTAEAARQLPADHANLLRYEPGDAVTFVAARDAPIVGTRARLGGRNIATLVFETGKPARLDDYAGASGAAADLGREWGFRAAVGAPIRVEGRLWGVMIVGSSREESLPADTEARLAKFTELVASAIANAQARVELRSSAEEQAALRRVATLVASGARPEEVFAAVTAEAGRVLHVDYTSLIRHEPQGVMTWVGAWSGTGAAFPIPVSTRAETGGQNMPTLVFETRRPARIDDAHASGAVAELARQVGIRSSVGVPINVAGRLWGLLAAMSTQVEPLSAGTEARLAGFTELVATAIANTEAEAALTASRARIVAAADAARRGIERDLHDGAQQRLVSIALRLRGRVTAAVPPGADELTAQLDGVAAELGDVLDELRELARGLHPAALAAGGLRPALRMLVRRSAVPVRLDARVDGRLPEPVELAAYYVVAEALTNAAKHADASVVDVRVATSEGQLRVNIRDDGRGGADPAGGSGLVGLKDRVEALGGRLGVQSVPGAGTTVRAELPLGPTRAVCG